MAAAAPEQLQMYQRQVPTTEMLPWHPLRARIRKISPQSSVESRGERSAGTYFEKRVDTLADGRI